MTGSYASSQGPMHGARRTRCPYMLSDGLPGGRCAHRLVAGHAPTADLGADEARPRLGLIGMLATEPRQAAPAVEKGLPWLNV